MIRRWTSLVIAAAALMTTTSAHCIGNGSLNIDVGSGWRQDTLNYSSTYPVYNVVSDLLPAPGLVVTPVANYNVKTSYNDIRIWNFGGKAEYKECGVLLRLFGQYGDIYAGHSSDTETGPTSATVVRRYNAESDRGEVYDFGIAAGYPICTDFCCINVTFTPIGGWSQSGQHFRQAKQEDIVDPNFTLAPTALFVGANIPKMYNSYQTRWNGFFAGYDLAVDIPDTDFSVYTGFEWHWPHFTSRGQYNTALTNIVGATLVPTGASIGREQINYTQNAWGNGFVVRAGGEWFMNRCWSIGLLGYYSRYWVNGGYQDASISQPTAAAAAGQSVGKLNDLHWTSWAVMGSIGYQY